MIANLKRIFSTPVFDDEYKNRMAQTLQVIILTLLAATILGVINNLGNINQMLLFSSTGVIFLISLWLLRRGYIAFLRVLIPLVAFGVVTYTIWLGDGIHDIAVIAYAPLIALASLLLGKRAPLIFTLLCIGAMAGVIYAEVSGILVTDFSEFTDFRDLVDISILLLILAVLIQVLISNLTNALERAQAHERGLIETNQQLRTIQTTLEERVEARTRGLELVATALEHLNILDFNQFLLQLVNQVKDHFNYYHVHVYLIDEMKQNLIMTAGAGAVGEQIKVRGSQIPLNESLNVLARAVRQHSAINIENVHHLAGWSPDPLLPETRSLLAVPIILDGRVVGIMEVQEDELAGFDQGDESVLHSLVNQVAVALRNARLFTEVETALAEAQALQEQYLQKAWETERSENEAYHYHRPGAPTIDEAAQAELEQAIKIDPTTLLNSDDQKQISPEDIALTTPIKLQNQIIGMMQFFEADPSRRTQWNEREVSLVQVIADQVAQTAENLRLLEETRQQASREQAIREITDKLRAAPNLDFLLETAARELAQRLGVRHTVVELGIEAEKSGSTPVLEKSNGF